MVTRIGGTRRKTRGIFTKPKQLRGKVSLRRYLQEFKPGDKVALKAEPSIQKGIYFRRFHGKIGVVKRKNGSCYDVEIKDLGKTKTVIVHPVHLKAV
ncbi:50S ribosomal protein L21e [Candidatus Woesearchaeota archaeon]|nr:MAG: 50S ribosomal protein L21e [Candidatus Woesearchaeota archaeon]